MTSWKAVAEPRLAVIGHELLVFLLPFFESHVANIAFIVVERSMTMSLSVLVFSLVDILRPFWRANAVEQTVKEGPCIVVVTQLGSTARVTLIRCIILKLSKAARNAV